MPSLGVYNASKAAAWSLTQSLRADFAKRQVKVFGVFPGAVDTDMLKGVEMQSAGSSKARRTRRMSVFATRPSRSSARTSPTI
jgi:NAD(P)-dependent dehydrogenase (short-subunit alcohol dehydrogenase family)